MEVKKAQPGGGEEGEGDNQAENKDDDDDGDDGEGDDGSNGSADSHPHHTDLKHHLHRLVSSLVYCKIMRKTLSQLLFCNCHVYTSCNAKEVAIKLEFSIKKKSKNGLHVIFNFFILPTVLHRQLQRCLND
jgi:hypothetical protein